MAITDQTPPPLTLSQRLLAIPVKENRMIPAADHSAATVRAAISRLKGESPGCDFFTRGEREGLRVWRLA